MQSWTDGEPLHLEELSIENTEPDPKALACYGLLRADTEQIWLRFVEGRPISSIPLVSLEWGSEKLQQQGKKALPLNTTWHISRAVRNGVRAQNRQGKQEGGVPIIVCSLPAKSPWLNRIEQHWIHGKRVVVEPTRKLTAAESIALFYSYYGCEHLLISQSRLAGSTLGRNTGLLTVTEPPKRSMK